MAKTEHINNLDKGKDFWNNWRETSGFPDLTGKIIKNKDLSYYDFTGAAIDEVTFEDCKFYKTKFDQATAIMCTFKKCNFHEISFQDAKLDESTFEDCVVQNASFDRDNFSKSTLSKCNFREAYFLKTDFTDAKISKSTFSYCGLSQSKFNSITINESKFHACVIWASKFPSANISHSDFQDCDLQDTDFSTAQNLESPQFGGTNLSGVRLPDPIMKFETLKFVEDISKISSKIYFTLIAVCLYSILTILITDDVDLLTNSLSFSLPLFGSTIQVVSFFYFASVILLCIFFYFHLYLQRLWEALIKLPAIFPDGQSLDRRTYPWLIIGLIRQHHLLLRLDRLPLSRIQSFILTGIGWWLVPFTLLIFYLKYLTRHDWLGTLVLMLVLIISICSAFYFQLLTKKTLTNKKDIFIEKKFWRDQKFYKSIVLVFILCLFFLVVSYGAVNGIRTLKPISKYQKSIQTRYLDLKFYDPKIFIPKMLAYIACEPFADFVEANVSQTTGLNSDQVRGARLSNADLKYANASGAFMVRADLRFADLSWSILENANLQMANLSEANLSHSNLANAFLVDVNFKDTDLHGADLSGANLTRSTNLEISQLLRTISLFDTRLDDHLKEGISKIDSALLDSLQRIE